MHAAEKNERSYKRKKVSGMHVWEITCTFYVMTGARVHNDKLHKMAPEEKFYRIQTMEFDEFCPDSGAPWNS